MVKQLQMRKIQKIYTYSSLKNIIMKYLIKRDEMIHKLRI